MDATPCASGARRSSVSGALKRQHRAAFGSAAIAQALGDEQSGRLGSIGCVCEVIAEFTLRGADRRSRCTGKRIGREISRVLGLTKILRGGLRGDQSGSTMGPCWLLCYEEQAEPSRRFQNGAGPLNGSG
jgi:hypothetical protein